MSSSDEDIEIVEVKKNAPKNIVLKNVEKEDVIMETPSSAECLKRCKEFASVTGTDNALAMFYLQDTNWNLQRGLDLFFEQTEKNSSKIVACFDVDKLEEDEKKNQEPKNKKVKSQNDEQIVSIDENAHENEINEDDNDEDNEEEEEESNGKLFKIMSWNIDGIDAGNLRARTKGVIQKILAEKPDVIMLQEVVPESESLLREHLERLYELCSGNQNDYPGTEYKSRPSIDYYTMILFKKRNFTMKDQNLVEFKNSSMGRNLLVVKLKYMRKVDVCVMTSHLESTAEYSKQRVEQLKRCFEKMLELDADEIVFFGGDLNLRDSELSAIGGMPAGIHDLWESTGSRKECLYTWDCSRNTNLKWAGKFKPKLRFDRLYFRPALQNGRGLQKVAKLNEFTLMPIYFELEGLEKLKSCGRFCSDHWAIQSYCQLKLNKAI